MRNIWNLRMLRLCCFVLLILLRDSQALQIFRPFLSSTIPNVRKKTLTISSHNQAATRWFPKLSATASNTDSTNCVAASAGVGEHAGSITSELLATQTLQTKLNATKLNTEVGAFQSLFLGVREMNQLEQVSQVENFVGRLKNMRRDYYKCTGVPIHNETSLSENGLPKKIFGAHAVVPLCVISKGVDALKQEVDALVQKVDAHKQRVYEQIQQVDAVKRIVDALKQRADKPSSAADAKDMVEASERVKHALKQSTDVLKQEAGALKQSADALKQEADALKQSVNALKQQVDELKLSLEQKAFQSFIVDICEAQHLEETSPDSNFAGQLISLRESLCYGRVHIVRDDDGPQQKAFLSKSLLKCLKERMSTECKAKIDEEFPGLLSGLMASLESKSDDLDKAAGLLSEGDRQILEYRVEDLLTF